MSYFIMLDDMLEGIHPIGMFVVCPLVIFTAILLFFVSPFYHLIKFIRNSKNND